MARAAARRADPLGVRDDRARRRQPRTPPTSPRGSSATATSTSSTAASGGPRRDVTALPSADRDGRDRPGRLRAHRRQTMVLVAPRRAGRRDQSATARARLPRPQGHAEVIFDDVRVPARTSSARRATASRSPRPGSGLAGSITPCARIGAAERASADGRAGQRARGLRRPARRSGRRARADRRRPASRSSRRGCCATGQPLIDWPATRPPATWLPSKVAVPRAATRGHRPGHPGHGGAGVTDVTPLAAMYALAPRRCACSTAPTRSTCARSRKPSLAAARSCRRGGRDTVPQRTWFCRARRSGSPPSTEAALSREAFTPCAALGIRASPRHADLIPQAAVEVEVVALRLARPLSPI